MADTRRGLGAFGEQVAAAFLLRRGWAEVARNWRSAAGEIDLVMRDGATLVFVEVRTRRGQPGLAEESVGRAKQARLIALAQTYLNDHDLSLDDPWRIDVVAVQVGAGGGVSSINHIPNALSDAS